MSNSPEKEAAEIRKIVSQKEADQLLKALDAGTVTPQQVRDAAKAIRDLIAERESLRRLDEEYGRVEEAIIMSDPDFDGDSDHETCGDRLIASVHALRDGAHAAKEEFRKATEQDLSARMVAAGMIPLDAITKPNGLSRFMRHAGVKTPEHYGEWLARKVKEYQGMVVAKQLGVMDTDPEIDNFILGKASAFHDALENAKGAGVIPDDLADPEDTPTLS